MRLLLFGDNEGVPQLLLHIPSENIIGIVGAEIRPQYHEPLEELAITMNVPFIVQPKWQSDAYLTYKDRILDLDPDLILVNSYSMIIRDDILSAVRLGGINIHSALLPKNRGCNPTQWAILNGETETGVSLHEMSSRVDEGAIIDQRETPLFFEDTWIYVSDRLSKMTDNLIASNLERILSGEWSAIAQVEKDSSVGRRRTPDDGVFEWSESVVSIYNKIRALLPPLPPAFYVNEEKQRCEMKNYKTIWQVTAMKYGSVGLGQMHSDRIQLRPLLKSDASLLYEWITNRDLVILNSPFYPVSESDHEAWVEKMMNKCSDLVIFVIEDIKSKQAIGTCQLLNINWFQRSAELQILIGNDMFQGKGYGTEAVCLLCTFGFNDLNLHRIYLHVFDSNSRAVCAYEKCGFEHEGILREAACIDGEWTDVLVMGIIRTRET